MICPVCRWPLDPNEPMLGLVPMRAGLPEPGGVLEEVATRATFHVHPTCVRLEAAPMLPGHEAEGRRAYLAEIERRMQSNLDAYAEVLPARAPRR